MNQKMQNYKAKKERNLIGGICISELRELQEKSKKYNKLKEAIENIKEDIENMEGVGYARDPEGFVEDEIVYKTDVENIIDKYTEGLI